MASFGAIKAGRAYVELILKDKALKQQFKGALSNVKSFANEAASLAKIPINIAFVGALPAGWIGKQFMEFDDQLRMAATIAGATNAEFQSLNNTARELGRTTSWTSKQVAEGMTAFARMGYDTGFINDTIKGAMDFARATGSEIEFAANFMGKAMHQFNLDESQASRVADVLAAAANNSAQTAEDLENAFKYAAPVAKSLNLTIEDMAVLSGTLANFGIAASQAGTTLRRLEVNVADPKKQAKMEELGVKVTDDNGNVKNLVQILRELGVATKNLPTGEKLDTIKELFGVYSLAGATSLVGADFDKMADAIQNAVGVASENAEFMDQGFGGAFRLAVSAVEGLGLAIGDVLAPSLIELSECLQGATPDMVDWIKENQDSIVSYAKGAVEVLKYSAILYALFKTVSVGASVLNVAKNTVKGFGAAINFASTFSKAYAANVKAMEAVETQEVAVKAAGIEVTQAETAAKVANAAAEKAAIAERKAESAVVKAQIKEKTTKAQVDRAEANAVALSAEATRLNTLESKRNADVKRQLVIVTNLETKANKLNGRVKAYNTLISKKESEISALRQKKKLLESIAVAKLTDKEKANLKTQKQQVRTELKKREAQLEGLKNSRRLKAEEANLANANVKSAQATLAGQKADLRSIQTRKTRIFTSQKAIAITIAEKQALYQNAIAERQAAETAAWNARQKGVEARFTEMDTAATLQNAQAKEAQALADLQSAQTAAASAAKRVASFKKIAGAVAIGGVVLAAAAAFYKLTDGMSRATKSAEKFVELAKKRTERVESEFSVMQEYLDKLKELADKESLSNEEKDKAIRYIDLLTEKYGNLGISVNEATGKINGLTEAQEKFNKLKAGAELKAAQAELKAQQHLEKTLIERKQAMERGFSWASIHQNLEALNPFGEEVGKFTFRDSTQRDNQWRVEEARLQRQATEARIEGLQAEVGKDKPDYYETAFSDPSLLMDEKTILANQEKVKEDVAAQKEAEAAAKKAENAAKEEAVAASLLSVPSGLPVGFGGFYEEPEPVEADDSILRNFLNEAQNAQSGAQFYVPSKPIAAPTTEPEPAPEEIENALSNLATFQGKDFSPVEDWHGDETAFIRKKDELVANAKQLNDALGTNIGVEFNPAANTFKVSDAEGVLEDWRTNFEGDTGKFLEYAQKQKNVEENETGYFDTQARLDEIKEAYAEDLNTRIANGQGKIDAKKTEVEEFESSRKGLLAQWNEKRENLKGIRTAYELFKDNPMYGDNAALVYRNAKKEFEVFSHTSGIYASGHNAGTFIPDKETKEFYKEADSLEKQKQARIDEIDGLLNAEENLDSAKRKYVEAIQNNDKKDDAEARKKLEKAKKEYEEYEKGLAGFWYLTAQKAYDEEATAENKQELDRAWENYAQYLQDTEDAANDFADVQQEAHSVWNTGSRGTFDAFSAMDMQFDWQRKKWDDQIDLMKQVAKHVRKLAQDDDGDVF